MLHSTGSHTVAGMIHTWAMEEPQHSQSSDKPVKQDILM